MDGSTVRPPPAVVVHDAEEARAAMGAAGPAGVTLLSVRGGAGSLGAPWFLAVVAAGVADFPQVPHRAVLDCADAPGLALAALRSGLRWLVLDPTLPAWPQVAGAAAACGATLLLVRPPALDLAAIDLTRPGGRRLLAEWLNAGRDDTNGRAS